MDLPPEILHIIFSFCSAKDLLESVQFVCQKWRESVLSPWVWREKILEVPGSRNSSELKSQLTELPFLKSVWLQHGRRQNVTCEALTLLRESCPLLEHLRIDCFQSCLFMVQVSQFTCLTYIDVGFQTKTFLHILFKNSNYKFPPLLCTVIFRNSISNAHFLPCMLQSCKFLQHVVVSHLNNLENYFESSLKNTLSNDKTVKKDNLRTFYRSHSIEGDNDQNILVNELSKFRDLKHLALKHNSLSDNVISLTIFKESCPRLVFLDLSYSCYLSTDAFDSVIKACPNLVYLSLKRCNVIDSTLLAILTILSRLQYLDLHGTLISSKHFPSIPDKIPDLQDLNICACRGIDQEILNVLINLMPNLIIVHPRKGLLKGAQAMERHHSFLEVRNNLDFM